MKNSSVLRSGRTIGTLMIGVAMSALLAGASAQPVPDNSQKTGAENQIPDDAISYESLTLEIALTHKTLADEHFLANDAESARQEYCVAQKEIKGAVRLSTAKANTRELLKADIEYRLMLLDRNIDYWGAVQTMTPDRPGPHLASLENLLADYEKLNAEITTAKREIGDSAVESAKLDAMSREIDGRVQAESVNQERIAIERGSEEQRQDNFDGRIKLLKDNRQRLENQIAAAIAQARSASAQLNRALTNAAASSLGIPPDVLQSVQEGKLDKAVLSAVTNSDLLTSADFSSAIAQVSSSNEAIAGYIKQGQDLVRRGQEVKQQLESYRTDLEVAAETFRNPSLTGLARVGEQIYAKLDDNTKREWNDKIRSAKPVMGAIELAQSLDDPELAGRVRGGVERYLATNSNFAREYLQSGIDHYVGQLLDASGNIQAVADVSVNKVEEEYAKLLGDLSKLKLDDVAVERLLDQVLRSWPSAFLKELPPPIVEDLVKVAGVQNQEALLEKLKDQGLKLVKERIIVRSDRVDVYDRPRPPRSPVLTISLADLGTLPQKNKIEKYGADLRDAFENELNRLRRSEGELRQALLKRLPTDTLEGALRRSLSLPQNAANRPAREANLKNQAWEAVVRVLPPAQRELVVENIASAHVGTVYMAEWEAGRQQQAQAEFHRNAGTNAPEAPATGGQGKSGEEAMAEQVALMALNAAVPGAGVAVQVAQSFFAFGEAIDRAQRLADELQANLSEELQLIEMVNESRLKQVVLGKEREISQIMKASAKVQYESYRFAITQAGANEDNERKYMVARRKLAFYLAERMREEFDALDRSIALWAGRVNSPRGTIVEMIKSDPQNLRLALDSEIHLFDWLNRERESTRADVDGLMIHWRQMVRLSKDLCQRLGCSTGSGALGQTHQTDAIRLTDLLSAEDQRRLRRWQTSGPSEALNLTLFLQPDGRFVPIGVDNVRTVDVRVGTKWPSGRLTALTRVRLSHPGIGYVQSGGKISREVLLPIRRWGNPPAEAFDTQELSRDWQTNTGHMGEFEGYPLYSAWEVMLEPVKENLASDDIWVRFAYRYIDRANVTTERQYLDTTVGGPSGLFEPAIVWKNDDPDALVTVDGRPTRVSLPAGGSVSIPFSSVPLLAAERKIATRGQCPSDDAALEKPAASLEATEPTTTPAVFAVCKPDEDIKRVLISHYSASEPNPKTALASAMTEFKRLKANECRAPRPIRDLEVSP